MARLDVSAKNIGANGGANFSQKKNGESTKFFFPFKRGGSKGNRKTLGRARPRAKEKKTFLRRALFAKTEKKKGALQIYSSQDLPKKKKRNGAGLRENLGKLGNFFNTGRVVVRVF